MDNISPEERSNQPKPTRRRRRVVLSMEARKPRTLTMSDLPELLEAHELCERIGWPLARELAGRIAP